MWGVGERAGERRGGEGGGGLGEGIRAYYCGNCGPDEEDGT